MHFTLLIQTPFALHKKNPDIFSCVNCDYFADAFQVLAQVTQTKSECISVWLLSSRPAASIRLYVGDYIDRDMGHKLH